MVKAAIMSIRSCRICDEIARCAPVLEAVMASITGMIAYAMLINPGIMDSSRAWGELLDYAPQPVWAMVFLAVTLGKLAAWLTSWAWLRLVTLGIGFMLFTHLVAETAMAYDPNFATYIYSAIAMVNFVAFVMVAWDLASHVRRGA